VTLFELAAGESPFARGPPWAGDEGSGGALPAPDGAAAAARARARDAAPLPPALVAAWPDLPALLAAALEPDAARRAPPAALLAHAAFARALPGARAGDWWAAAIDWNALLGAGPLPPIDGGDSDGEAGAGAGAPAGAPPAAWGAEAFAWGSASGAAAARDAGLADAADADVADEYACVGGL